MTEKEFKRLRKLSLPIVGDVLYLELTKEFVELFCKAMDEIESNIKSENESEGKSMLYNVSVKKEEKKVLEMYYLMRGIKIQTDSLGNEKKVVCAERELSQHPDSDTIAQFLYESGADFMSLEQNYRFQDDLPFA